MYRIISVAVVVHVLKLDIIYLFYGIFYSMWNVLTEYRKRFGTDFRQVSSFKSNIHVQSQTFTLVRYHDLCRLVAVYTYIILIN